MQPYARRPVGSVTVHGSGIALLGTLGEHCCEVGHAGVFVDGRKTFDETGIWQNKSSSGRTIDGTILFVWRWRTPGTHTISFQPGSETQRKAGPSSTSTATSCSADTERRTRAASEEAAAA
jgi:hypothetical protein